MDNGDCVLLVEGQDDKQVVLHLCRQNSSQCRQFHIEDKGGVSRAYLFR